MGSSIVVVHAMLHTTKTLFRFKLPVLIALCFTLVKTQEYNAQYYDDGSDYTEDYDMNAVSSDADDYSDYNDSGVDDFDPSGVEDDMIDNPEDLHLIGEVSFDEDSKSAGLTSMLGVEEGQDGFKSANPENHFNAANEHQAA